jgi:hypothetical protein
MCMKWLVTVDTQARLQEVYRFLAELGCTVDPSHEPVPLDQNEQVIQAEGPKDLPARAQGHPAIRRVYPSSEMTLY